MKHDRPSQRRPSRRALIPLLLFVVCLLGNKNPPPDSVPGPSSQHVDVTCPAYDASTLPDPLAESSTVAAGTIPGAFSVSSGGQATYTLSLAVPPGRLGMEPKLAIVYDSAAGEGPLGVGFGLQGLSAITRCPANMAQDGHIRAVRYDTGDHFCLDGVRLVPVPHSEGANGAGTSEWRTFPDTMRKVVSYAGAEAKEGPQRWRVYEKGGQIEEYGGTADSQAMAKGATVAAWHRSSAWDRRGNAVDYTYENDPYWFDGHTQEILIHEISYTRHDATKTPASRRVSFGYEHTGPRTRFAAGLSVIQSHLLTKIHMRTEPDDTLVRSYDLAYEPGTTTGRNTLRSVTECAGDGVCKPPTRFTWSDHPLGFTELVTPLMVPPAQQGVQLDQSFGKWVLADVNGDGLDDLVVVLEDVDDPTFDDWTVALNIGGTFGLPTLWAKIEHPQTLSGDSWDGNVNEENWTLTPMDYDQDGRTDILLDTPNPDASSWPHYRWLKSRPDHTFELRDTAIVQSPGVEFNSSDPNALKPFSNRFARIGDVNGDGMGDLIQCVNPTWNNEGYNPTLGSPIWTVNLWVPDVPGVGGPGFDPTPIPIPGTSAVDCSYGIDFVHVIDIDGDGAAEILMLQDDMKYGALRFENGAWVKIETSLDVQPSKRVLHWLDANGDGLPDAFYTGMGTLCEPGDPGCSVPAPYMLHGWPSDVPFQAINNGKSFSQPTGTLNAGLQSPWWTDWWGDQGIALDYDGDGRTDFMLPVAGQCPDHSNHACWTVLLSNPAVNGFSAAKNDPKTLGLARTFRTPIGEIIDDETDAVHTWFNPVVTDVDGDGRHDLVAPTIVGDGTFTVYRNGGPQDLLLSVTDGMSALDLGDPGFVPTVSITYGSLVDRSITDGLSAEDAEKETYLRHADPDNGCAYPRSCIVGAGRVVSFYALNDGRNEPRHFSVKYRDARYHRLGRGMLGFGERIVLDEDAGSGRADFYDNVTWDDTLHVFPFAGQAVASWGWSPASAKQAKSTQIELTYAKTTPQQVPTDPRTYFTLPIVVEQKREEGTFKETPGKTLYDYVRATSKKPATVLADTFYVVSDFDTFGNVLSQDTYADEVNLDDNVTRIVENDTARWLIGEVTYEETSSLALGKTAFRTTSRKFNGHGEVISAVMQDPLDPATHVALRYDHDAFGNVTRTAAEDAFGHDRSACVSYEPEGIFPYAARNQLGHTTLFAYDTGLGVLTGSVDPNGLATHLRHDGFGRVTEEKRPDGSFTLSSLSRHKNGGPKGDWWNVKILTEIGGGPSSHRELDSLGRPVHTSAHVAATKSCGASACAPELKLEQDTTYDHFGRVTRVTQPWMVGDALSGKHADTYEYDDVGRVVAHVEPWGRKTTYTYAKNVVAATDWLGTTKRKVDALGRTVEITDKDGGTTETVYGPFSLPYSVTRFGNETTTTVRDAYGRVREEDDADRGLTFTDYDGFGEVLSIDDAAMRHFEFDYDGIGRLVERNDTVGAQTSVTRWAYDTAAHGIGKIARVTSPEGHVDAYTYTTQSQVWRHKLTLGDTGESFASSLGYDDFGRLDAVAYPHPAGVEALSLNRTYDAFGNVVAVRDHTTNEAYWKLGELDGAGRATREVLGNGVTVQHDYAPASGVVTRIQSSAPGKNPKADARQDLAYTYDLGLRMTARTDALQAGALGALREGFSYDAIDRLTSAAAGLSLAIPPAGSIDYAPNGNIKTKDGLAYAYDPGHPHAVLTVGAGSFVNDAVGNQTERPGVTLAYTPFDLPASYTFDDGTSTAFAYDGGQHRIRKTRRLPSGATLQDTTYFDDLYEQVRTDGFVHRFYVGAGSATVVLTREVGGKDQTAYLLSDALGSVDVVTDGGGAVIERRSYDAFGARRNAAGWGAYQGALTSKVTPVGFTGQEEDDEAGLVNMRGRIYDPKVGRFLSTDPLVSRPGFAQSWNPYSYVLNSPLNFTDPSGFDGEQTYAGLEDGGSMERSAPMVTIGPGDEYKFVQKLQTPVAKDAGRNDSVAGTAPTPPDDGTGGSRSSPATGVGGGTPDPLLSTGGGGANSGRDVQRQLTPEDYRRMRENIRAFGEELPDMMLAATSPQGVFNYIVVRPALQAYRDTHPLPADDADDALVDQASAVSTLPGVGMPAVVGAPAGAPAGGVDTAALEARAQEVHSVLQGIAAKQRTTAVLDVGASRIVGGGVRNLDKVQRAVLQPGEIPARLAGAHAEITVLEEARKLGLAPRGSA